MIDPPMSEERNITLIVADDHTIVRRGLVMLLDSQPEFTVLAEAAEADEALRKVKGHHPDVLVLDLAMPGRSALESIPELLESSEGLAILVLTMESDPGYARQALRLGATGYLLKEAAQAQLVAAVKAVASGSTYLHPELGARLAQEPETRHGAPPGDLTDREAEVLGLIALGYTNQEVADLLFLSVRTVESHRAHIQQKLGMNSRAELVRFALDCDLVDRVKGLTEPLPERPAK